MKILKLSNGMEALLDDDSYESASKHVWQWAGRGKNIGARTKVHKRWVTLHRFVMNAVLNPHVFVVFKDGNTLNYQKSNLELKSRSAQSTENAKKMKLRSRLHVKSSPLLELQRIKGLESREAQLLLLVKQHMVPAHEVDRLPQEEKLWQKVAASLFSTPA